MYSIYVLYICMCAGNQSTIYQYVVSLYWAVATTSNVGYGDIYAYTDLEVSYLYVLSYSLWVCPLYAVGVSSVYSE